MGESQIILSKNLWTPTKKTVYYFICKIQINGWWWELVAWGRVWDKRGRRAGEITNGQEDFIGLLRISFALGAPQINTPPRLDRKKPQGYKLKVVKGRVQGWGTVRNLGQKFWKQSHRRSEINRNVSSSHILGWPLIAHIKVSFVSLILSWLNELLNS